MTGAVVCACHRSGLTVTGDWPNRPRLTVVECLEARQTEGIAMAVHRRRITLLQAESVPPTQVTVGRFRRPCVRLVTDGAGDCTSASCRGSHRAGDIASW
jgi:hypothetical protein